MPVKPASSACLRGDSTWHAGRDPQASCGEATFYSFDLHLPDGKSVGRFDTPCVCLAARVREISLLVALHCDRAGGHEHRTLRRQAAARGSDPAEGATHTAISRRHRLPCVQHIPCLWAPPRPTHPLRPQASPRLPLRPRTSPPTPPPAAPALSRFLPPPRRWPLPARHSPPHLPLQHQKLRTAQTLLLGPPAHLPAAPLKPPRRRWQT
jgi:hypothetical protein